MIANAKNSALRQINKENITEHALMINIDCTLMAMVFATRMAIKNAQRIIINAIALLLVNQMKPGMSCVAHCDICDSWCQEQEQQNTLTTDDSGRKCSVNGNKLQCDQDRAPCGGTLGHLCRCQTKCPP